MRETELEEVRKAIEIVRDPSRTFDLNAPVGGNLMLPKQDAVANPYISSEAASPNVLERAAPKPPRTRRKGGKGSPPMNRTAPILGPLLGVVIFLLAGLLTIDTLWQAFLPAGLYLGVHLIEGQMITPMLLARRFILNPVLVIISLVFWLWMWGAPGAILSVPVPAITKIICDRVRPLASHRRTSLNPRDFLPAACL